MTENKKELSIIDMITLIFLFPPVGLFLACFIPCFIAIFGLSFTSQHATLLEQFLGSIGFAGVAAIGFTALFTTQISIDDMLERHG